MFIYIPILHEYIHEYKFMIKKLVQVRSNQATRINLVNAMSMLSPIFMHSRRLHSYGGDPTLSS